MSKDARECHTIPYYVTHVQFHPILCYIIFISLMCNVRSRKAKRGRKGGRGRGGGGARAREGFPIIIFSRPNHLLAFSSNQLFLFVVLEKKRICFQSAIIPPREWRENLPRKFHFSRDLKFGNFPVHVPNDSIFPVCDMRKKATESVIRTS